MMMLAKTILVVGLVTVSQCYGQTVLKRTEHNDNAVLMKCGESSKCDIGNAEHIYESALLSMHTHYSLKIVEYSDFMLFTLMDNNNLFEYQNISFPVHSLYQLHTAKEIIKFVASSVNESRPEISSSLVQHSEQSIILTIYVRYQVLNRDIILLFVKRKENEMEFMSKLIHKVNNDKKKMDEKLDAMQKQIDRLKQEFRNINVVAIVKGMILMFDGGIANIPKGYVLCDGSNGTPDLRDKFVVGAGNMYNVGKIGGAMYHYHAVSIHSETIGVESTEVRIGGKWHRHKHHNDHGPNKKILNSITDESGMHSHQVTMDSSNHLPPFYSTIFTIAPNSRQLLTINMHLALTDLVSVILWLSSGVDSQCATYNSYCLTGLSPTDYASFIGAHYEYKGTDEGCEYFENTQLPNNFGKTVYLHWDTTFNKWYIGEDLSESSYWAFCTYSSLDSCTTGAWTRFDGTLSTADYSMSIIPCSYDNTQCLAQYNNSFAKNKHNDQDFCVRNTRHRSTNYGVSDSFSVSGCSEEKPYYTINSGVGVESHDDSVLTLSWDNELSVWHMSFAADIVAWNPVAYCSFDDINACSNNWYIFGGEDITKDTAVISGLCDTCTDTKYDSFCIYGGVGGDQFDLLVGIYEPDSCVELMNSYNHTQYDDYYTDDLAHGGNLTLHYYCYGNSWRIDVDYDRNVTFAVCDEIDDLMECSGNWTIYDPVAGANNVEQSIQSGSCDIIYQQCLDDVDEEYLCITEADNDASVLENDNYYTYIAGEFKYLECDDEGFPIYVRHRDNNGNYLNEEWYNSSMISFDSSANIFSLHKYNKTLTASQDGHWLYCRALLVELCDTFMHIYDVSSDEWVVSPSIRLSKQRCNYGGEEASFLDTITQNWIYFVIGLGLLLLCCICALYFICRPQKDPISVKYDNVRPSNPPIPKEQYGANNNYNNYNYNRRSHNANVVKPAQTSTYTEIARPVATPQYPTKQSVSYKERAPPPYDPNYDTRRPKTTTTKYSDSMKMENARNQSEGGQSFRNVHVTFGDDDVALAVLVNENGFANWSNNEIVEWINNIGLKQQWKETAVNAVQNGQFDGEDMMQIKSGKDIADIFGIQNPMLCSRLWKELKKIN